MLGFQPPAIGEEEIAAVAETLRSGWLTTGPRAAELERRMTEYLEAEHVLALASGTAALHLALVALGIGPGRRGDHDADHLAGDRERDRAQRRDAGLRRRPRGRPQHRPERVARARDRADEGDPAGRPRGQPADLDPLLELGIPIVEDAAHAAESRYRGRKVGAIAEVTCFSLYATKNIAAGEGGLISTNRDEVAQAVRDLRLMRRGDGSRYDIAVPGYKANLSDVLAAIALCQLDKVERHAEIRRRQFAAYDEAVAELAESRRSPATTVTCTRCTSTSCVSIRRPRARRATNTSAHSREENIATSIHFLPVHKLTFYRERFPDQPALPVAERAGDEILSLPLSPAHSDDDIADAIAALRRVHERFTG